MKLNFFGYWAKLKEERRLLTYAVIMLTAVVIVMSVVLMQVINNKTVVVLPPSIDREFWVSGNKLSTSYIEQVGFFLSDRILTVNPKTARESFDAIVPFLTTDPRLIKEIKNQLAEQADIIKRENYYQAFYPNSIEVNGKTRTFEVRGTLRRAIGTMHMSEKTTIVKCSYVVNEGRFFITKLEVK